MFNCNIFYNIARNFALKLCLLLCAKPFFKIAQGQIQNVLIQSLLSSLFLVIERQQKTPELPKIRVETKVVPDSPTTPTSPTQVTLSKAPTPWLQKNRQQEDLPEWAKRSNIYRSQDSTPESPIPQPVYIQQQQQQQQPPPPPRQYGNVSNQQRPPSRNNNERVVPLKVSF